MREPGRASASTRGAGGMDLEASLPTGPNASNTSESRITSPSAGETRWRGRASLLCRGWETGRFHL